MELDGTYRLAQLVDKRTGGFTSSRLNNRSNCGWLAYGREPIRIFSAINPRMSATVKVKDSGMSRGCRGLSSSYESADTRFRFG